MTQTSEPRIYNQPNFNLKEIAYHHAVGNISEERAKISRAYFGRESVPSTPDPRGEIGLNFDWNNSDGRGTVQYQSMTAITGLMNDLKVDTAEQMKGKNVLVYLLEHIITGVSALPKK